MLTAVVVHDKQTVAGEWIGGALPARSKFNCGGNVQHTRRKVWCRLHPLGHYYGIGDRNFLMQSLIQLDCPSDGHWDVVGTTSKLGLISNMRPFLDSSTQTIRGKVLVFCVKPKNGLV